MFALPFLTVSLLCSQVLTSAKPLSRRQDTSDLAQYLQQVESAVYVAEVIFSGNATTICGQPGLVQDLDDEGLDGQYAERLMSVPCSTFSHIYTANIVQL